jgi:hypothetical protein
VVAENAPYEAWKVVVKNNDTKERHISLFPYVMFDLNGFKQPIYYSASTTTETMYVKDAHAILARTRNPFIPHETCQGYIATDAEVFAYAFVADKLDVRVSVDFIDKHYLKVMEKHYTELFGETNEELFSYEESNDNN